MAGFEAISFGRISPDPRGLDARGGLRLPVAAFDQRVYRFKTKWIPKWKKHKRDRALVIVVVVALLIGAALGWLLQRKTHEDARPTAVPVLAPAPTASVAPEQFNNADPTQEEQPKKPAKLKP